MATLLPGVASAQEHASIETHPSWGFIGTLWPGKGGKCTVSLVDESVVLTARHCVAGARASDVTIHLGGITEATQSITRKGTAFAQKAVGIGVDSMVLIYLDRPVKNTPILRLAGSSEGSLWATGTSPRSYGWGQLSPNVPYSAELRYSTVKVLDTTVSASVYRGMLKAGRTNPSQGNPSHGDSGGPLIAFDASGQAVQIGVLSSSLPTGAFYFMKTGPHAQWLADQLARI